MQPELEAIRDRLRKARPTNPPSRALESEVSGEHIAVVLEGIYDQLARQNKILEAVYNELSKVAAK